jgi:hypothetical protein
MLDAMNASYRQQRPPMKKLILALLFCSSVFAATKPVSPVWQSGNPLASGIVRYWYTDSSLTTITDYSPGAHNLTFTTGTPTLTAAPGGVGNEYLADGNQIATGVDTGLPAGASSVAAWVKTTRSVAVSGDIVN